MGIVWIMISVNLTQINCNLNMERDIYDDIFYFSTKLPQTSYSMNILQSNDEHPIIVHPYFLQAFQIYSNKNLICVSVIGKKHLKNKTAIFSLLMKIAVFVLH